MSIDFNDWEEDWEEEDESISINHDTKVIKINEEMSLVDLYRFLKEEWMNDENIKYKFHLKWSDSK